jgi:hypothetical protein
MLAGLRICSDFELPGIPLCRCTIPTDVEIAIRRARVPKTLSKIDKAFEGGQCNKNELLLDIPQVARYLIRGGREILVDECPNAEFMDLSAYLLGTAFGLLCHQRGITPLHASSIDVAGGYVAFVGASGAGKSTLVAALAALGGHQVIADDVCFLQLGHNGEVQAWPGVNRIRLWEDSLDALKYRRQGVEQEARGSKKYILPLSPAQNPIKSSRLRIIYQLHAALDNGPAYVKRLQGASAIEVLMQNIYKLGLADQMGYKPAAFVVCATMARQIPVFRFSRPMSFDVMRKGVEVLEDHMRSPLIS